MSPRLSPISRKKYLKKIKSFGIEVLPDRGKGGEWIIRHRETCVILTLPHLKEGEDVKVCYIRQTLRRFNISRKDWMKAK